MKRLIILALACTTGVAHADDGLYLANGFSMGAPSVKTSDGTERDALTAFRVRGSIGYRQGRLAIEPNLSIQSIDRHDYPMNQSTTIYDYASAGAQVKYIRPGPFATYARFGGHHSWSGARSMRPPMDGGGIDFGVGLQLGAKSKQLAAGFFLDLGHEITWIGPDGAASDRISTTHFSIGFAAGTGY